MLMYELDIIISLGFPAYFLIIEEIIRWCAEQHIPVGCFKKT